MKRVCIIAEAGVNHNGNVALAHRLVEAAAEAGADAVKFQTFKSELCVSRFTGRAEYQQANMPDVEESQLDMIRRLELHTEDFFAIKARCDALGILFLTTTADIPSTDAVQELLPVFKIGSSDIDNFPLLRHLASFRKPVILSTGMATLAEIEPAVLVFRDAAIVPDAFPAISLLHCTTNYPCPAGESNLRAMATMAASFGLPVGYSDHTAGIEVPVAAVALGAHIIEKHFTLDRTMQGPDHRASLEPAEFRAMVAAIRNVEIALGNGVKQPTASERAIMPVARKSLVAARDIEAGERLTADMVLVKRPGTGIPPKHLDAVLGMTFTNARSNDDVITWEDFKHAD